jgi:serine/threonine-protein kinase
MVREAEAAATVRGARFVEVLAIGRVTPEVPFIVMEYLVGETLQGRLERGPLPLAEAVDSVLQACEGLAVAHARGIVHRDVKPANLFACADASGRPAIKILDLGISMLAQPVRTGTQLTTASSVLGTPAFSSPEQLAAPHEVDQRADIWSLGVTLYVLASGARPFEGDSLPQLCASIFNGTPPPLHEVAPVPAGLSAVVARCLEKQPQDRFQSVQELAAALDAFASTARGVAARLGPPVAIPTPAPGPRRPSSRPPGPPTPQAFAPPGPAPAPRSRGASPIVVVVMGALAIALFASAYAARSRRAAGPAPSASEVDLAQTPSPTPAQSEGPAPMDVAMDPSSRAVGTSARPRATHAGRPTSKGHPSGAAPAGTDSAPKPDPGSYR